MYRCVLDLALSLCQCKLGSGRFSRAVFSAWVEPEPWASPEQVGFQKAYGGISQIHGVKTWPNSDWPLSGSTLTFCSISKRCNKLFSVCVAGDYWSKTLSLLSHLQGEGGKGLGREKERRRKQREVERRALRKTRERKEAFAWRAIVLSVCVA